MLGERPEDCVTRDADSHRSAAGGDRWSHLRDLNPRRDFSNLAESLGHRDSPGLANDPGPPSSPFVTPTGPIRGDFDPVEQALADALGRAAAASQWSTVELLSRELQARREARAGVVDLRAERRKRDGDAT